MSQRKTIPLSAKPNSIKTSKPIFYQLLQFYVDLHINIWGRNPARDKQTMYKIEKDKMQKEKASIKNKDSESDGVREIFPEQVVCAGFYSPWDFILHTPLKSTHPPGGTKLIPASLTDSWHFHHLMCLNERVCARCLTQRPRKYCHSWPGANSWTVGKTRLQCCERGKKRWHLSNSHNAEVVRALLKNASPGLE